MGYFFLILALVSFGTLGVLHKVADFRKCRPEAINLFLFLWAALAVSAAAIVRPGSGGLLNIPNVVVAVAFVCGIISSIAILNFQRGVRYGKISTSWLIINLSTAVPTVLSILVYHEEVGLKRAVSLLLVVAALVLLWLDRREEEARRAHFSQADRAAVTEPPRT